ncbi:PhzF family phenazine biosynthesis protein, partial [Streptomyces sp. SID14478]|uniref:PhzF family phenazine biosynthesis protein n=1 Tax=Streptomyces sp. SID14478 TaxID=2706073 RepID=UPI0013D92B4A
MTHDVLRYTAFATTPDGGNPAGIVLDASALGDEDMLKIAADLGYSESAFLTPGPDPADGRAYTLRYFSPKAEVPFCGHATVATAVALAERHGTGDFLFHTPAGEVPVSVTGADGVLRATLTSVAPHVEDVAADDLAEALAALDWPA